MIDVADCKDCGHKFYLRGTDLQNIMSGGGCPQCGGHQVYRTQVSPTHSDMEARDMVDPGSGQNMGGNPLQEGIYADTDGGWQNRMKRDEEFSSKTAAIVDAVPYPQAGIHFGPSAELARHGVLVNGEQFGSPQDIAMKYSPMNPTWDRAPVTLEHPDPNVLAGAKAIVESGNSQAMHPYVFNAHKEEVQPHSNGLSPDVVMGLGNLDAYLNDARVREIAKPGAPLEHNGEPVIVGAQNPEELAVAKRVISEGSSNPAREYRQSQQPEPVQAKVAGPMEDVLGLTPEAPQAEHQLGWTPGMHGRGLFVGPDFHSWNAYDPAEVDRQLAAGESPNMGLHHSEYPASIGINPDLVRWDTGIEIEPDGSVDPIAGRNVKEHIAADPRLKEKQLNWAFSSTRPGNRRPMETLSQEIYMPWTVTKEADAGPFAPQLPGPGGSPPIPTQVTGPPGPGGGVDTHTDQYNPNLTQPDNWVTRNTIPIEAGLLTAATAGAAAPEAAGLFAGEGADAVAGGAADAAGAGTAEDTGVGASRGLLDKAKGFLKSPAGAATEGAGGGSAVSSLLKGALSKGKSALTNEAKNYLQQQRTNALSGGSGGDPGGPFGFDRSQLGQVPQGGPQTTNPGEGTALSKVADYDSPGSVSIVPGLNNGDDFQYQDPKEFAVGDLSNNLNNPNLDNAGGLGSQAYHPAIQKFHDNLPLLLHYYDSDESGREHPDVLGVHHALESAHPGYLAYAGNGPLHIHHRHHHHHGALPQPGVGTHCPQCGGVIEGNGHCPQCGYTPPQQQPAVGTPQIQPTSALDQGPQTDEQRAAVAELLEQEGRAKEIPNMLENGYLYAEELSRVQHKLNRPPENVPPEERIQPPIEAPPPGGGMPMPGMQQPQPALSSIIKRFAVDNVAPACPRCGSHTTGVMNEDGESRCHSCGNIWKAPVEQNKLGTSRTSEHPEHHEERHNILNAPAADQQGQRDIEKEQDSSGYWKDSAGNRLVAGEEYEMHSAKYSVPDIIRVESVKPDEITFTIQSQYGLDPRDQVSRQEAQIEQLSFAPYRGDNKQSVNPDEQPQNDDYSHSEGPGQVTDLSTPPRSEVSSIQAGNEVGEPPTPPKAPNHPSPPVHPQYAPEAPSEPEEEPEKPSKQPKPKKEKSEEETESKESSTHCSKCESTDITSELHSPEVRHFDCYRCGHTWNVYEDDGETVQSSILPEETRAWVNDGETGPVAHIGMEQNTNGSSRNLHDIARTAGAKFTPREQKEFIDEKGTARNSDRLDLAGTHYESTYRTRGDGMGNANEVNDDHLALGI